LGLGYKLQLRSKCWSLQIHDAFKNFSEIGLNFILFLVKSSDGWLYYNSSIGPIDPGYKWDPLRVAVEEAHGFWFRASRVVLCFCGH